MKQDESLALAALFDCWSPRWNKVDGPHNFRTDVKPALRAFGFDFADGTPLYIARMCDGETLERIVPTSSAKDIAILLTGAQLRSPAFLHTFRRNTPNCIILAAKSGLYWAVWQGWASLRTGFYISTAEYLPARA